MIGLINAIGSSSLARFFGSQKSEPREVHGIQVPIPLAQKEAKAESKRAVFGPQRDLEEADQDRLMMSSKLPGSDEAEREASAQKPAGVGERLDVTA